jgi:hypothetical protein
LVAPRCRPGPLASPLAKALAGLWPHDGSPRNLDRFSNLPEIRTRAWPHIPDLVGELVDQDAVPEGRIADVGTCTAVHGQTVAAFADHFDGAVSRACLLGEHSGEAGGMGGADGDTGAESGAGELRGRLVRDESALLERDDVICGARGHFGLGRGEEDGATLGGVRSQHAVQPVALTRGEAVGGIIQHECVRVRQQGAGQAKAAIHATRQGAEPLVTQADQAHHFEYFVGTPGRNSRRGTQHAQMAADRTRGMAGHLAHEYADLARGVRDAMQRAAPEVGEPTALLEFEHQSERCRLARTRRSEKRGDAARKGFEGHVVDRGREVLAGIAGQSERLDHP